VNFSIAITEFEKVGTIMEDSQWSSSISFARMAEITTLFYDFLEKVNKIKS